MGLLHFRAGWTSRSEKAHGGTGIELEEIEFSIEHHHPRRARVRCQSTGGWKADSGEIVAHVAAGAGHWSPTSVLEQATRLPCLPTWVPRRVVLHENLPKNANGKIDRTALT